jgi:hypothetical protein
MTGTGAPQQRGFRVSEGVPAVAGTGSRGQQGATDVPAWSGLGSCPAVNRRPGGRTRNGTAIQSRGAAPGRRLHGRLEADHDTLTATVSLDNARQGFDALLERLSAVVGYARTWTPPCPSGFPLGPRSREASKRRAGRGCGRTALIHRRAVAGKGRARRGPSPVPTVRPLRVPRQPLIRLVAWGGFDTRQAPTTSGASRCSNSGHPGLHCPRTGKARKGRAARQGIARRCLGGQRRA